MKVAVVCANGRVGKLVAQEAVDRGMDVTAVVRDENGSAAPQAIVKDVFDLEAGDLSGFDAVVDAFGAWTPDTIPGIPAAMKHLADLVAGTDTRLVVVGGAGSLFVDPEHTVTLDMGPDFPEDWKPLSAAHGEGLADLRSRDDVAWTYVSPAADFQADGVRTGNYILGSEVSYADFAIALVDELERAEHIRERISVVRK